jgi:tRNA pseudouridine38-40 synthase
MAVVAAMTRNLCLILEYDGTDFKGWQVQPDVRTVQDEVEKAIARLYGRTVRITAAGRTDTGVHALGQVANFAVEGGPPTSTVSRALNGILPSDVVVKAVREVPAEFNARRHATLREYEYRIVRRRAAVGRRYAWHYLGDLDLPAMRSAASLLVGHRDFTSFCVAAHERDNRVCDIRKSEWTLGEGLVFRVAANRFLRGMVRAIVGTLVQVGRGTRSVTDIGAILDAQDRGAAGPAAPPEGLFLKRVDYELFQGA